MPNDENSKTPTWQWVAIAAISVLLTLAAIMLNETRADIKEVRISSAAIGQRVAVIETGIPLQFETIKAWREEMKINLKEIIANQKEIKSNAVVKKWNNIK